MTYNNQLNHGMRAKQGMSPTHNCVFVESNISEEELASNWENAFGKPKKQTNGGYECTCNYKEENINGALWLVKDRCYLHGRGFKKELTVTEAPKKHSLSHQIKARQSVFYGNIDPREVTRRN